MGQTKCPDQREKKQLWNKKMGTKKGNKKSLFSSLLFGLLVVAVAPPGFKLDVAKM